MYSYPILPISVSETQVVVGFCKKKKKRKKKTKVRETFLLELLNRRDSFYYYIVDPHDERLDVLLDYRGSI